MTRVLVSLFLCVLGPVLAWAHPAPFVHPNDNQATIGNTEVPIQTPYGPSRLLYYVVDCGSRDALTSRFIWYWHVGPRLHAHVWGYGFDPQAQAQFGALLVTRPTIRDWNGDGWDDVILLTPTRDAWVFEIGVEPHRVHWCPHAGLLPELGDGGCFPVSVEEANATWRSPCL